MPPFTFNCPHCQQSLEAPPEMSGADFECPSCQKLISVPTISEPEQNPSSSSTTTVHAVPQARNFSSVSSSVIEELKLSVRRLLKSSFYEIKATEHEKSCLTKLGVTSQLVQDYAAWRKSMVFLSVVLMIVTTMFTIITSEWIAEEDTGNGFNAIVINIWIALQLLLPVGSAVLLVFAGLRWYNLMLTRKLARFAWIIQFFGVFLLFLVPLTAFLDMTIGEKAAFGSLVGITIFVTLLPRVIGLFSGLLRSSMTLKTLLPESSAPGWVAIIIAPLYSLFFALVLVVALQMPETNWLCLSLLFFTLAPLVYVFMAGRLMAPAKAQDAHLTVLVARRRTNALTILALLFGVVALFNLLDDISLIQVFQFVAGVVANIVLLTVVTSDLVISLLREAFNQNKTFAGSELQQSLEARFEQLNAAGLTEIGAGEAHVVDSVGSAVRKAVGKGKEWLQG